MTTGAIHVTLPDGRRLGYAEYGDPDGRPLLYFHGFPGSRIEASLIDGKARSRRLRIIAVDRPGYGESEPQAGRRLVDWPVDVAALADRLGLERFSVLGVSGGGPYALACARRLAGRLREVGVASGLGPVESRQSLAGMIWHNRLGLLAARRAPRLPPVLFALIVPVFRLAPRFFIARLAGRGGGVERPFFESRRHVEVFVQNLLEGFRQGHRGPAQDVLIYSRPWGFRLEEVPVRVRLWHGERDVIVPAAMGRRVAERLPDCEAVFHPEEGHFSMAVGRAGEVLDGLADLADRATPPA